MEEVSDNELCDMVTMVERIDAIEETFLKCYINEIVYNISTLVSKGCYGCEIDHPSQRRHECLMMLGDTRMLYYFDKAKRNVDRELVMEEFFKSLDKMDIILEDDEMVKFNFNNCYNVLCSTPGQEMKIEERVDQIVSQSSFY